MFGRGSVEGVSGGTLAFSFSAESGPGRLGRAGSASDLMGYGS